MLENHAAPCGAGVPASTCPPIKVTNNSYGPTGGGAFDPQSATAKLQRALVDEGVVTVWANGNDGGDGSESLSNPPGMDPTGGILSVASFYDQDTGTRDGTVSDFSSRGKAGDQSTYPDISAPGENITSSCRLYLPICSTGLDPRNGPGATDIGTFNTISGTSMAAPHIAGIVAQLFQANPAATPAAGRGGAEDHRVQVHRRCGLRAGRAGHHELRQGLRPRRRGGRGHGGALSDTRTTADRPAGSDPLPAGPVRCQASTPPPPGT